jgi:hypothetical protein
VLSTRGESPRSEAGAQAERVRLAAIGELGFADDAPGLRELVLRAERADEIAVDVVAVDEADLRQAFEVRRERAAQATVAR